MADRASAFGFDMKIGEDLDPSGRSCSGEELVADGVLHRLMADTLPLAGAPGGVVAFGVDVSRWVGEVTTRERAEAKAPLLMMVIGRDRRIDPGSITVDIDVEPDDENYDLTIEIGFRTVTGVTVEMVVGVSRVTVDLLAQQGQA